MSHLPSLEPAPLAPTDLGADALTGEPPATRHPTYQPIHKALRAGMAQVLLDLGRLDTGDADECRATLARAHRLLALLAKHLAHENQFIHPALDALGRGHSARAEEEHGQHQAEIEALMAGVQALLATCTRVPLPAYADTEALRLYRRFALFMADNLVHMHHEETTLHAVLCAGYSDAQLQAMHARLLASVPPADTMQVLACMLPALSPSQRAHMLGEMRTQVPPAQMQAVLDLAQSVLDRPAWRKLTRALQLAPGAVTSA